MLKQSCRFNARSLFSSLVLITLALISSSAGAQTLTENNRLTFGEIVMRDNSGPKDIELMPDGSYVADPAYLFFTEPELGNYSIIGQVPNTVMNITLDTATTTVQDGGGQFFTLVDAFTVPAVVTTDGAGNATFEVGATLRSSGNGIGFSDNLYAGSYVIIVTP